MPAPYTRGRKKVAIACKGANLRRARFLCAARKFTLEKEKPRISHFCGV